MRKLSTDLIKSGSFTGSFSGSVIGSTVSASYAISSSYVEGGFNLITGSTYSITSSHALTSSYNLNSISSSYSLSSSYAANSSGGTTLTTGSTYPITSSWSNNSVSSSYSLVSSTSTSSSYATSASFLINGILIQTGSIANQTVLYNVTTSQDNIISGLSLSGNKWGVSVIEEWDSGSIPGDTYYNSCSLLLHFNGTNNSTTFTDDSPNNLTVTSNNGAKITSSISKFGNASLFLDGTNDYVTVVDSSKLDFGSGDFTIEYWEYRINNTNSSPTLARNTNSFTPYFIWHGGSSTIELYLSSNGSSWDVASAVSMGTIITNAWTHYAVTRNGNTFRTFQNGTQISSFTSAASLPAGSGELQIGRYTTSFYFKGGYIDELRITKGVARYTGSFTTSSVEFPGSTFNQLQTKYIGLVGGLNDSTVDYGVEKLSDTSLKIRKMSSTGQPLSGSGELSSSVDRVYVNVLNYDNVTISGSISNAITASYTITASYALSSSTGTNVEIINQFLLAGM